MSLLQTLLSFLVVLGVVIVCHELGHFWVARWCGVRVLRFSVGFGRPLVRIQRRPETTEWVIAAIPLGGYVRMLDEREGPVASEELERAFNRQGVWKRIAIVVAGPVANFVLAILVYTVLHLHGVQELKPILGSPVPGSIAEKAGIREGDLIVSLDGKAVESWQDFRWRMLDLAVAKTESVRLEIVDQANRLHARRLDLRGLVTDVREADPLRDVGLLLYRPPIRPILGRLESGGAADRGGLQAGDRIVAVGGSPIDSWQQFVEQVRKSPDKPLLVTLDREGALRTTVLVPARHEERGQTIGRIGARVRDDPSAFEVLQVTREYDPLAAVVQGVVKTGEMSIFSVKMLWRMLTGDVSWRNLSGPVTIADYAGQSASLGWMPFLTFIALVSISIGILNLLPIPILDGGHLLYYSIEALKGSPLSERVMEFGQRVGLAILVILMGFAFYNDIARLLSG